MSRDFRRHDGMPDACPALPEVLEVARLEVAQNVFDLGVHPRFSQEVAISLCADGEPVRDLHPGGCQLAVYLAERGILPTNQRDIIDVDFAKPVDILRRGRGRDSRWR